MNVVTLVCHILHSGSLPTDLNHMHICLLPKVRSPRSICEFHQISLCNVVIKIVTKCIANYLKGLLMQIVDESHSAFFPSRLITDNVLVVIEVFHHMKMQGPSSRLLLSLKLDMAKAYDRVEWGFLEAILLHLGFVENWVSLVM